MLHFRKLKINFNLFVAVYGAYVIAIVALLLVLILFCQKFLKLWKKSQKNRRSYDPMLPTEVKVVNTGEKKPQEQENRESDADQPLGKHKHSLNI